MRNKLRAMSNELGAKGLMRSEFFLRGIPIAVYEIEKEKLNFWFNTQGLGIIENCNAPNWQPCDLLIFAEWLEDCVSAHGEGRKLLERVDI